MVAMPLQLKLNIERHSIVPFSRLKGSLNAGVSTKCSATFFLFCLNTYE